MHLYSSGIRHQYVRYSTVRLPPVPARAPVPRARAAPAPLVRADAVYGDDAGTVSNQTGTSKQFPSDLLALQRFPGRLWPPPPSLQQRCAHSLRRPPLFCAGQR